MTEKIKEILEGLPGVVAVSALDPGHVQAIHEAEGEYEKTHVVRVSNLGLHTVLHRDQVFILLKTAAFRKPPVPTLYMVEEVSPGEEEEPSLEEHRITVEKQSFKIVGEEVLGAGRKFNERVIPFNDGFILFPERRRGGEKKPAYFLIPPIPFPELEERKEGLSIRNVMSVSPCTLTDTKLRELYQLPGDAEYATILVGFDWQHEKGH